MVEVTTIRSLPEGRGGEPPRVEVSTRKVGLLGRVVGLLVLAGVLAVLAIFVLPFLLIGLAALVVLVIAWLLVASVRLKVSRTSPRRQTMDHMRENVRVRAPASPDA